MSTTVALVLGSGGARGYAHIGVIQELERRGYVITSVTGTSIGALVGGLWAAGKLDEYCEWVAGLDYFGFFKLLDVSLSHPGLIKGNRLFAKVRRMIGDITIDELPVPYTAVATNLKTRKEIWFQQGELLTAIRASSAIPSLFTPVDVNGQMLVDGAVLNPLPMAPAGSAIADCVMAVDLLGDELPEGGVDEFSDVQQQALSDSWLSKIWPGGKGSKNPQNSKLEKSMGMINVFYQSMEVMQESLARYKVAGHPPDILVSVPKNICRSYDFHKMNEVSGIGRTMAAEALDKWEEKQGLNTPVLAQASLDLSEQKDP